MYMTRTRKRHRRARANTINNPTNRNRRFTRLKTKFPIGKPSTINYIEFDTIGCAIYSSPEVNDFWKRLLENTVGGTDTRTLKDVFLARYKTLHPEDKTDHTGINILCMDNNSEMTHAKVQTIKGMPPQPGLNLILSCSTSDTSRRLNRDKDLFGNKQGYYYIGFVDAIHPMDNVIFMSNARMSNLDVLIESIDKMTDSVLTKLEELKTTILTPSIRNPCHYFTETNLLTKIRSLIPTLEIQSREDAKPKGEQLGYEKYPFITEKLGSFEKENGTLFTTKEKLESDTEGMRIDTRAFIGTYLTDVIRKNSMGEPIANVGSNLVGHPG